MPNNVLFVVLSHSICLHSHVIIDLLYRLTTLLRRMEHRYHAIYDVIMTET